MARVTVEDCLKRIDNQFELVLVASRRARQVAAGAAPKLSDEESAGSKPSIIALREVASGLVDKKIMDEPIISESVRDAELSEMMTDIPESDYAGEDMLEDEAPPHAPLAKLEEEQQQEPQTAEEMEKMADLGLD